MIATAKLFKTGSSQAVRLPKACRLPGDEVWINKNKATGVVTLTPKPGRDQLKELFRLIDEGVVPASFMTKRPNPVEIARNSFAGERK